MRENTSNKYGSEMPPTLMPTGAEAESRTMLLPMMPLRGMLVFPGVISHLDVGRERSICALEAAMAEADQLVFLAMQKKSTIDDPREDDIHEVGVVARIRQTMKLPGGTMRLLVDSLYRAKRVAVQQMAPYFLVEVEPLAEENGVDELELEAMARVMRTTFETYASRRQLPDLPTEALNSASPSRLADQLASHLQLSEVIKQALLEEVNVHHRMEILVAHLQRELTVMEMEKKISEMVREQIEANQKEYYLREQQKAIAKELNEKDERGAEVEELRKKAQAADLPDYVMERVEKELERLAKTPPLMAEGLVNANYLQWLIELPWNTSTAEDTDIKRARKILDADHYGLDKAKDRIIEYLAVRQLTGGGRAPIICLVGPPGVGKTSIAKSVARALNRKFVRMSLGGVRDEAEVRGHRRTYVGALPGRIIQNIKLAGSNNPLFLLDELDKTSGDYRGEVASALLEALDPEQNSTFADHYIELPFDLSKVLFFTTANLREDIPGPLLDRMEIIEIPSYTEEEKLKIAKRHLLPKQLIENGIGKEQLKVSDNALRAIIRRHTREAGVRELERRISRICRAAAKSVVAADAELPISVTEKNLSEFLGRPRYDFGKKAMKPRRGIATGLAWTEVGGELLSVEVVDLPGKGELLLTGNLGDVMKESARAAHTFIRSQAEKLGIDTDKFKTSDLHIHVPEGATPKDGPSAGVTIATAIASALSGLPVRADLAMTGEITLSGRVLAVGGIREKMMAAFRGGIYEAILPKECERDLEDIPESVRKKMKFHLVEHADEVLRLALVQEDVK